MIINEIKNNVFVAVFMGTARAHDKPVVVIVVRFEKVQQQNNNIDFEQKNTSVAVRKI